MRIINTTQSIRTQLSDTIKTINEMVEKKVEETAATVSADVKADIIALEQDTSPVLHSITSTPLAIGTDITIQLHHARGDVRRMVVNGTMTVEQFISKLRSLV